MRHMALPVFLMLAIGINPASGEETARHNLMPAPAEISFAGERELVIDATFRVEFTGHEEPRLERAAERLLRRIAARTGSIFLPDPEIEGAGTVLRIRVAGAGAEVQSLAEDESYRLEINAEGAFLSARTPVGALRGLETFLQLIEPGARGFAIPVLAIEDRPRFPWRGLLIDSCRHWMPPEVIVRTLEAMASVKMNVLHWHLSEDQGFRVESRLFPRLHRMGSDGNYYSQETIRDIVALARDLGIRVVPEFDMPGHTTAWLVGHPELASAPGPYRIGRAWGVFLPVLDPTREEVYEFIDSFVGEMANLFPDGYFHIGGDEVDDTHWLQNPRIREFMDRHGMAEAAELQAYFNRRLSAILERHGKKMVGWDEILHPDLPADIVVQSWRGPESLAEGARRGYLGILSHGYYLDLFYPASDHYAVDPLGAAGAELTDEEKERILGGEACMWGELITPELIDSRIWPRAAAIAERLWSGAEVNDVDDMYRRLEIQSRRLEHLGLNHRSFTRLLLERVVGPGQSIGRLTILAGAAEPVRGYERHRTRPYRSYTPLNRFVDAMPAESSAARRFNREVEAMLRSDDGWQQHRDGVVESLQELLDNHPQLLPLLRANAILRELVPFSADLARLAEAGLEAIELIEGGREPAPDWRGRRADLFEPQRAREGEEPLRPRHELRVAILPGIRALVERALDR